MLGSDAAQFLILSKNLIGVNSVFGDCDPPSFLQYVEKYQFNNRKPNLGKITANALNMPAFEL